MNAFVAYHPDDDDVEQYIPILPHPVTLCMWASEGKNNLFHKTDPFNTLTTMLEIKTTWNPDPKDNSIDGIPDSEYVL